MQFLIRLTAVVALAAIVAICSSALLFDVANTIALY